jgi:hypothetical protein
MMDEHEIVMADEPARDTPAAAEAARPVNQQPPADRARAQLHAERVAKLEAIKAIGAPLYALPRQVPLKTPKAAPPKTLAWWGQQKHWPPALVAALAKAQPAAKTYEETEILALAHLAHAQQNSIRWWALHLGLPAWLTEALAHGQPLNLELTEQELVERAVELSGLPLGRMGAA